MGLGATTVADQEMTRFAIAIAAAIMAVFLCLPALAQVEVPCGPYIEMIKRLKAFDEALLGRGIDAGGRMVEIWGSPADGWTIILVRPDDMVSCVMTIGQKGTAWQAVKPPLGPNS